MAHRRHDFTHVVALSFETTGPNVVRHWIPELAASFWRIGDEAPLAEFYRCVAQPDGTEWDQRTRNAYWSNGLCGHTTPLAALERRCATAPSVTAECAMRELIEWARMLERTGDSGESIVAVTLGSTKSAFLNQYFGRFCAEQCPNIEALFGAACDIEAFCFGVGRVLKRHGADQVALDAVVGSEPAWLSRGLASDDPRINARNVGATASFILAQCLKE